MIPNILKKYPIIAASLLIPILTIGVLLVRSQVQNENSNPSKNQTTETNTVKLLKVSDYQGKQFVKTTGEVRSSENIDIKSEISSEVQSTSISIGEDVKVGQRLITLKRDSILTELNEARANLETAKSQLKERKGSLEIQLANLEDLKSGGTSQEIDNKKSLLEEEKQELNNIYNNTVIELSDISKTASDAIKNKTTNIFDSYNGKYKVEDRIKSCSGQTESDASWLRFTLESDLEEWSEEIEKINNKTNPTNSEIDNQLVSTLSFLKETKTFLEKTNKVLTTKCSLDDESLGNERDKIDTALSNINNSINTVKTKQQNIESQKLAINRAKNDLEIAKQGSTEEKIKSQKAQVKKAKSAIETQKTRIDQSQANVEKLRLKLDKATIESPINGTVSSFNLDAGDFVSSGETVASIVNKNGRQVRAYLSSNDVSKIETGADVTVEENIKGRVSNVAPSINSDTKKIEVIIALLEQADNLIIGEFVDLKIKTKPEKDKTILPLKAVRTTTNESFVLVVEDNGVVSRKNVELGNIEGESVEIKSGIDKKAKIISDTAGIEVGSKVEVKE